MNKQAVLVVGAGAAGYFAAIAAKNNASSRPVVLVEAGSEPLRKVAISGGGRCNVTHHCFEPAQLVKAYPRGGKELRSVFSRFQPQDTVQWFESRGVKLKVEEDGRMFPITDSSSTIIDCLENERKKLGVELRKKSKVLEISHADGSFKVTFSSDPERKEEFGSVLLATGSTPQGYKIASTLGHTITSCVPSLFTFEINDARLEGISGVSVSDAQLELSAGSKKFQEQGPVLVTHWGLSGPAVIRLSAWAAKELADSKYQAEVKINWIKSGTAEKVFEAFKQFQSAHPKKNVLGSPQCHLPKRLWERLVQAAQVKEDCKWAEISKKQMQNISEQVTASKFLITGKGVFKEEFVTCGGVELSEVDFKRMESKLVPGLFFAGEILDIDGITGGFNFQSAWSTGFIAGNSFP